MRLFKAKNGRSRVGIGEMGQQMPRSPVFNVIHVRGIDSEGEKDRAAECDGGNDEDAGYFSRFGGGLNGCVNWRPGS